MLLLAFATSSNSVSAAVLDGGAVMAYEWTPMERGQGEALIPMIDRLMNTLNLKMKNLDAIAVAVGPGSFTGVRVALSTARALGLALKKPVWGVSDFEIYAFGLGKPVTVVLDTKRGDYYTQDFDVAGKPVGKPGVESPDQLACKKDLLASGDGAKMLSAQIGCPILNHSHAPAICVGKIALTRVDKPLPAEPIYLRDAEVTC